MSSPHKIKAMTHPILNISKMDLRFVGRASAAVDYRDGE